MATGADVENLMTCGVCKCKYDNDNRKPKFLQCAHTACHLCLKEICQGNLIKCPFCCAIFVKLNVESLPDNPYALHILNFKENEKEQPKPIQVVTNPSAISWCLTCASAEKPGCAPNGHSFVGMTADTIRNLEGLLKSKEELMQMKETGMEKLTMAIEERKKVHEQLALILKSIQHSEEEIKKLQDENNIQMIQMVSLLEKSGSTAGGAQDVPAKKELYFSQLMSIVEDSTTEDNVDTLKRKMEKSIELYDEKQCESMAINSEYKLRKKIKIAVHLFDENDRRIPTVPFLENGFRFQPLSPSLSGSEIQQDSILVSHAVFSLLKHQKIELKREEPAAASAIMEEPQTVVPSQKKRKMSAKKEKSQQPIQSLVQSLPSTVGPIPMNKFVLDNLSIFKFRIFHSGYLQEEIVIRPLLKRFTNCDFVQKLGEFCFKTQKVFCSEIDKALPGVYVKFSMSNAQFQPSLVPEVENLVDDQIYYDSYECANQMDEVGLGFLKISSDKIDGWSFIFPLRNFQNRKYTEHVRNVSKCVLFGRVISRQMMEIVTKLSSTKESERSEYSFTLESQ